MPPRRVECASCPVATCRLVSVLCSGSRFGAKPAPGGTASFCFPGTSRNKFVSMRQRAPHKLLQGPTKKALLGTGEPGPLPPHRAKIGASGDPGFSLGFARCDPSRIREFNETEITTMYQNKVTLIGFLGNDAEVRTNDNRSLTTLSLATKSSYKKDGNYISQTEWHRCVVFGKLGEFAGTLKKGAHIQVEGELRSREYDSKKTGGKQTIWEVRVSSILKLDRAEKAGPEDQDIPEPSTEGAAA